MVFEDAAVGAGVVSEGDSVLVSSSGAGADESDFGVIGAGVSVSGAGVGINVGAGVRKGVPGVGFGRSRRC